MRRPAISFEQLAEPVVPVRSIRDIKSYLVARRPTGLGLPVVKYEVRSGIIRQKLMYPDGTEKWMFYGYLEDVALNIQRGLLEPQRSSACADNGSPTSER